MLAKIVAFDWTFEYKGCQILSILVFIVATFQVMMMVVGDDDTFLNFFSLF